MGASSGHCLLYDLRSSQPLHVKEHQNSLPVSSVAFHSGDGTSSGRRVLSSDGKVVKLWSRGGAQGIGATLANIETQATVNDLTVATDARGDSGLLLMAAEQSRVMSYYVPALGPAPRWCSFLDVITEEVRSWAGVGLVVVMVVVMLL